MTYPRWQRLLWRSLPAVILPFAIQACTASGPAGSQIPGSVPPAYPPFDAYDVCIQGTDASQRTEASRQNCFKQTIQANHLALPAGTTTEQAFAKYKDCVMKNVPLTVSIGEVNYYGDKHNAVRQNCFASALQ
jgi:hypothetical protein